MPCLWCGDKAKAEVCDECRRYLIAEIDNEQGLGCPCCGRATHRDAGAKQCPHCGEIGVPTEEEDDDQPKG